MPRYRTACFLNFILLFPLVPREAAIVLSGKRDLQNALIFRGAKESSEGYEEVLLPENLWIYFFSQEKMNAKNIWGGRVTQFSNHLLVNSVTVIHIRQREREREEK